MGEGVIGGNRRTFDDDPTRDREVGEEERSYPVSGERGLPVVPPNMKTEVLTDHRNNEATVEKVAVAVENTALGELAQSPEVSRDPVDERHSVHASNLGDDQAPKSQPAEGTSLISTRTGSLARP